MALPKYYAAPQQGAAYSGVPGNAGLGGGYVDPTFAPPSAAYMNALQSQLINAFGNLGSATTADGSPSPFASAPSLAQPDPIPGSISTNPPPPLSFGSITGPDNLPKVSTNPPNPLAFQPLQGQSNIGLAPASFSGPITGSSPYSPFQTPNPNTYDYAPNGNPILDYQNGYSNPGMMSNLIGLFGNNPPPPAPVTTIPVPQNPVTTIPGPNINLPPPPPMMNEAPMNPRVETPRPVPITTNPPPAPSFTNVNLPNAANPRVGTNPPNPLRANPFANRPQYQMQYQNAPSYSGGRYGGSTYGSVSYGAQPPTPPPITQTPGGNVPLNGAALQGRKLPVRRTIYGLQTNSQEIPLVKGMMSAAGIDPESAFGEFQAFLPKGNRASATIF